VFFAADASNLLDNLTLGKLQIFVVLVLAAFLFLKFFDGLCEALAQRVPRARFFFKGLAPIVRFATWFALAFGVILLFAPTEDSRLALLASSGIAIGLGAQDLIKNLVGGLVVLVDRPYQLGDRVKIGDAYGEIDHIGLRSTKLTTPDDTRVTIPNSDILSGMVWNSNGGVPDCQVVIDMYLPVNADIDLAQQIGYEAAYSSPYLLKQKPVVVLVSDIFEHRPYLRIRIKAYVFDHRYEPRFMSDVTVRAKKEFQRQGLQTRWE